MQQPQRPVLILTRPADAALRTVHALGDPPVEIILCPLIQIAFVEVATIPEGTAGLILTSPNGAAAAAALGLPRLTAWCVGDKTAEVAEASGFDPVSAQGDADVLVQMILEAAPVGPLLHVRGAHSRGNVAVRIQAGGIPCEEVVAYRQQPVPVSPEARAALGGTAPVILPIYSPRTAELLAGAGEFLAPIHIVAISPAVAEAARGMSPDQIDIAQEPNGTAMIDAILRKIAALAPAPLEGSGGTD